MLIWCIFTPYNEYFDKFVSVLFHWALSVELMSCLFFWVMMYDWNLDSTYWLESIGPIMLNLLPPMLLIFEFMINTMELSYEYFFLPLISATNYLLLDFFRTLLFGKSLVLYSWDWFEKPIETAALNVLFILV